MRDVLRSGFLSKGRHLRPFEEAAAEHLGVTHAVVVSSGTKGLTLTYQALGLTCEVVVPSFTFMATVSVLVWVGARPAFPDVIAGTTNLDPAEAEAAVHGFTFGSNEEAIRYALACPRRPEIENRYIQVLEHPRLT